VRRFAARGVLPLEADDRIRALFAVLEDSDPEVARVARGTLNEFPPDAFADFLRAHRVTPAEIDRIASLTDDVIVLEQAVRHRNVSDATLLALARTVAGAPQEALVVNQARLLRNPALIDALFSNPSLESDARRMLNELKEEFFEKEARRRTAAVRSPSESRPSEPEPADVGEEDEEGSAETADAEASGANRLPEGPRGAEELYLRIMQMSVPERVKLALTGGHEERRFLIGDSSKLVGLAVLRARGLTLTEVEGFCTMRHLEQDIFYRIVSTRNWIRRPRIVLALVKNPAAPLPITMRLVPRLPMRELRNISRDRNLPEAIRVLAKKTYLQRRR